MLRLFISFLLGTVLSIHSLSAFAKPTDNKANAALSAQDPNLATISDKTKLQALDFCFDATCYKSAFDDKCPREGCIRTSESAAAQNGSTNSGNVE